MIRFLRLQQLYFHPHPHRYLRHQQPPFTPPPLLFPPRAVSPLTYKRAAEIDAQGAYVSL